MNDHQPTEPLTGDQFAQIVRELGGPLVLYARQLCTQPEDVVQEALLKLLAEFRAPPNVRAWLFRVVRHTALNNVRGEQRRRKHDEHFVNQVRDWFEPSVSQLLEMKEAMDALRQLPNVERETIIARLWGDLTLAASLPAMKYELLRKAIDRRPGNAAVHYGKVKSEQNNFFSSSDIHKKIETAQVTPLSDLKNNDEFDFLIHIDSVYSSLQRGARSQEVDWQLPLRDQFFANNRIRFGQACR